MRWTAPPCSSDRDHVGNGRGWEAFLAWMAQDGELWGIGGRHWVGVGGECEVLVGPPGGEAQLGCKPLPCSPVSPTLHPSTPPPPLHPSPTPALPSRRPADRAQRLLALLAVSCCLSYLILSHLYFLSPRNHSPGHPGICFACF